MQNDPIRGLRDCDAAVAYTRERAERAVRELQQREEDAERAARTE